MTTTFFYENKNLNVSIKSLKDIFAFVNRNKSDTNFLFTILSEIFDISMSYDDSINILTSVYFIDVDLLIKLIKTKKIKVRSDFIKIQNNKYILTEHLLFFILYHESSKENFIKLYSFMKEENLFDVNRDYHYYKKFKHVKKFDSLFSMLLESYSYDYLYDLIDLEPDFDHSSFVITDRPISIMKYIFEKTNSYHQDQNFKLIKMVLEFDSNINFEEQIDFYEHLNNYDDDSENDLIYDEDDL